MLVRTYRKVGIDDAEERILPVHKCTLEDYDKFAEPSIDTAAVFEAFRKAVGTKRGLWCFDFDALADELAVWGGGESDASYQRIEFVLVPCNYLHTQFGYEGDSIHEECNHSLEAQQEYLGNIKMFFLTEEFVFN